jgi:hypothetical protein
MLRRSNKEILTMMNVYRFHELAALNPPQGDTFYLTEREAVLLSAALMRVARSINTEKFSTSALGTIAIDCTGSIHRCDT